MTEIDVKILESLQWMKNPVMDKIMISFTALGNSAGIWILIALLIMLNKKYRTFGIYILLGLIVGFFVGNVALKNIIARPRPSWQNDKLILLIANPHDYSFPSGHTMHSFIAATMLVIMNRKWGVFALLLAGVIGFSRLYLYVHYPSDVICGGLIGIAIGVGMMWLYYRKQKEF